MRLSPLALSLSLALCVCVQNAEDEDRDDQQEERKWGFYRLINYYLFSFCYFHTLLLLLLSLLLSTDLLLLCSVCLTWHAFCGNPWLFLIIGDRPVINSHVCVHVLILSYSSFRLYSDWKSTVLIYSQHLFCSSSLLTVLTDIID